MRMKYPAHPGRLIRSDLEALGMGVVETARKLGVSTADLRRVLDGQASVTPEMAVKLDALIGGGATIWNRLQAQYDEAQERNKNDVPEEPEPLPSYPQTATVPLEHGRLVYTTYDDEVIAFRVLPSDGPEPPDSSGRDRLEFRFVGEGPGAVRIQLIYQASPHHTPRMIADVLFKAYLEWDAASEKFVGRIDGAEWNRETQRLRAGIETINSLHAGLREQPSGYAIDTNESEDSSWELSDQILGEAEELLHKGTASVSAAALASL